jgi:hypothetical protein
MTLDKVGVEPFNKKRSTFPWSADVRGKQPFGWLYPNTKTPRGFREVVVMDLVIPKKTVFILGAFISL